MPTLYTVRRWLRTWLDRARVEQELDEELRFHLEMEAEKLRRRGLSHDEARRAALVAFGGRERFKEEVRDERGTRWLDDLARDLRLSLRGLQRERGFTSAVVLSLALGVGAAGAVFAFAYGVLLRPLPYPAAERLVELRHVAPGFDEGELGQSDGTYLHYRRHARSFEHVGAYFDRVLSLTDGEVAERVEAVLITRSALQALGVAPMLGGGVAAPGAADSTNQIILSHDLWVRRYGADPAIVGRTVEINRGPRTVVGVMPPDFRFPRPTTQLWFVMGMSAERGEIRDLYLTSIARLRPGVSAAAAEAELRGLVPGLAESYGDVTPELLAEGGLAPRVVPLREALTADVRPALVLILATALLVLVITWANVANLSLVRAERRRREVAVATALGASTGRLLRRALAEGLVLGVAGGALGLAVTWLATAGRFAVADGVLPRLEEVRVDGAVLALVGTLAGASALLVALVSHLSARATAPAVVLKGATARTAGSRDGQRAQRGLVVLQVAISLALLVGAGAMAQTIWRLRHASLGFVPERAIAFEVALPVRQYASYDDGARFFGALLERLRAIPGVTGAEAVSELPLSVVPEFSYDAVRRGDVAGADAPLPAQVSLATPGYFRLLGIPLEAGRTFERGDLVASPPRVLVSAALGRALFGGLDPVGRTIRLETRSARPFVVAGVLGDVPGTTIADGPERTLYFPVLDDLRATPEAEAPTSVYPRELKVVLRTAGPPTLVMPAVRAAVRELDPKVPVADVRLLDTLVERATIRARLTALLLLVAAGAATLLGVVGLYGVVSYAVSLRTPEFGVRLALGASPAALRTLVLREGTRLALVGVAVGLAASVALMRLLRGLLYQVAAGDPLTLAGTTLLLLAVTVAATWLPARRAARTDPAIALRSD
jgi:putative ABC transport system permease protein